MSCYFNNLAKIVEIKVLNLQQLFFNVNSLLNEKQKTTSKTIQEI